MGSHQITELTHQDGDQLMAAIPSEKEYFVVRSCCGVPIELRSNVPALLALLARLIPGTASHAPAQLTLSIRQQRGMIDANRYQIAVNGRAIEPAVRLDQALHLTERYLQEALAMLAADFVFVHAAVVEWKGTALLMPGMSLSGKSTLAMALVDQGARYYSDEFAVIGEDARVHPYLRLPRLRGSVGQATAKQTVNLISDGLVPPPPVSVGLILLSRYSEEATWSPRALTCREVLFGLLQNTVAVRQRPDLSIRLLKEVSIRAKGIQSGRGEAQAVASLLLGMI